jgi:hypothetical protein
VETAGHPSWPRGHAQPGARLPRVATLAPRVRAGQARHRNPADANQAMAGPVPRGISGQSGNQRTIRRLVGAVKTLTEFAASVRSMLATAGG